MNFDRGRATFGGQRKGDALTDQMAIPFVVGMDHHHTTGTNQFRPGGGNHQIRAVLAGPSDINEFGFSWEPLNFRIGNRCSLNRVVDVGAEVLDDVAFLE